MCLCARWRDVGTEEGWVLSISAIRSAECGLELRVRACRGVMAVHLIRSSSRGNLHVHFRGDLKRADAPSTHKVASCT